MTLGHFITLGGLTLTPLVNIKFGRCLQNNLFISLPNTTPTKGKKDSFENYLHYDPLMMS